MKDHTLNVKSLVMMLGASCTAMGLTTHVMAQDFTWFVDDNAQGGIGDDWDTAFNNLEDALEAAEATLNQSDLIKVARGKYFPTNVFPAGDPRNATFFITQGVTIEGGYAGVTAEPGHEDDRDDSSAGSDSNQHIHRTYALHFRLSPMQIWLQEPR